MIRRKKPKVAEGDYLKSVALEKDCPECGGKLPVANFEVHKPANIACPDCGKTYTATRHGDEIILEPISGGSNDA